MPQALAQGAPVIGEEDFDAFFAVSYSRIVGQLYAMTGDWEEAQAVVLEAFIRAWDYRSQFDLETAPDSWVRIVAWNLTGLQWRQEWARPAGGTPAGAGRLGFVDALRGLNEDQRRATVLHYLCDQDYEDIAAETGVTLRKARARVIRGRAALDFGRTSAHPHDELVEELYDFANLHAHARLSAHGVRERGDRRGRKRQNMTLGSIGALAAAGAIAVALLAASPSAPPVAASASHHSGTHHVAPSQSPS
ncbi:hypothetical protein KDK95_21260 [Actinospica sp. MGRD01-02]|uniref:RNA polymerase sigma factor 70 region 4 type 2 domain-containing protein n=1 Tax=Actinospica acidithermotolerans TaxID=2828514 RepID=A0A941IKF0_9ACTN|nr:sigma factor-like helix-turn-helix DNA-binding protein [Actinospica acidithermotolerans]MBR7828852.1 hypothetical protein [Actinospica acidithermotolerans]